MPDGFCRTPPSSEFSWYVYMNDLKILIKGGYSVEVSGSDWNNVLWGFVYNHVFEEGDQYDGIGLRGFDLDFYDKDEDGVVIKGLSYYPYLLI